MAKAAKLNDYGFDEDELGFSGEDLEAAMRVVKGLGENISAFKARAFKDLRGALHPLIEEQMKNYDVKGGASNKRRRGRDRDADAEEAPSLKELDKQWRNQTALRAKRLATLEALNAATGPLAGPGGVPLTITHKGEVDEAVENLREQQLMAAKGAGAGGDQGGGDTVARVPDGVSELTKEEELALAAGQKAKLNIAAKCYICKKPYVDLHFFYDQLCPGCAELNYRKRNEIVDMAGKVAIVTGARVKIGYRCALKLLRCGCTVVATSRFATDCARRYEKETDSGEWISRLQCYGIDFRDLAALEQFCGWIKQKYKRLDVIINNACQTIRRPAQYYSHLMQKERAPMIELPERVQELLRENEAWRKTSGVKAIQSEVHTEAALPGITIEEVDDEGGEQEAAASSKCSDFEAKAAAKVSKNADPAPGPSSSSSSSSSSGSGSRALSNVEKQGGGGERRDTAAEMSQMPVIEEDTIRDDAAFPSMSNADGDGMVAAVLDVNEQQVDLRRNNSWVLKLHEVSTGEMAEVMAINAMAPAIINARLKNLMAATPAEMKFIVNVSAMEGKFYRWKSDTHPHTNMAKAALNMMTRTSAQDYLKSGIYMTAVDTGWINDEVSDLRR